MMHEASYEEQDDRRYYYVGGQAVELWENPDIPFGWSNDHMESYAGDGDWESLFNALVIASLLDPSSEA